MKKQSLILFFGLFLNILNSQTNTGTITFTPPAPGKLVATAGSVTCNLTGNAVPATAISIQCNLGPTSVPSYTIPLPAGSAFTFDYRLNGDAVTIILQSNSSGLISYQVAATPNGGTQASGSGNF